jgi:drug/metabolite transporter (DMT)-like permease
MGLLLHLLSVAAMAVTPLLNKWTLESIDPLLASCLNGFIGGAFGLALTWRKRKDWIPLLRCPKAWTAGLFNAAGLVCLFSALMIENPVVVGLIGRLYIPMTGVFAIWVLNERVTKDLWLVLGITFIGVLLFVWRPFEWQSILGLVLSIGFATFFAMTNTLGKKASKNPWIAVSFNQLVASVLLFPLVLSQSNLNGWHPTAEALMLCSVSAIIGGFVGLGLFFEGLKRTSMMESSIVRCLSPLFVAAYTLPFFPIEFSAINIFGGAIVIASCVLFVVTQMRAKPSKSKSQNVTLQLPALQTHLKNNLATIEE